jgi:hypothetical protein
MTGELVVPDIKITGLTGATASSSRLVGTTTSGPPVSGTFAVGDMVIDQTATIWFCTTAGTPGTWINVTTNSLVVRSATATAGPGEFTIFGTTGTSGQTITLPANAVNGSLYQIKNLSPYTVNILGGTNSISVSGTIYGASTPYTIPLNAAYTFVYSGGVWYCFTTTDINKMGGLPLATSGGGTGLSTIGTAGQALVVNAGATGLTYTSIVGTQGAQGPQGFQGNQGNQGNQGTAGTNGAQGPQGSQGNQGTAGTNGAQGAQGAQGASFSSVYTAAGQIDYATGSGAQALLNIGTAGQVLTVNSGATAPAWTAPVTSNTVSSFISTNGSAPLTAWGNITSVSLTAGTWLVTAQALVNRPSDLALSPTSASNTSAYVSTSAYSGSTTSTANAYMTKVITLASTTTVYLIVYNGGSTTGSVFASSVNGSSTPNATGITAVRIA